jgi:hypothetical protein
LRARKRFGRFIITGSYSAITTVFLGSLTTSSVFEEELMATNNKKLDWKWGITTCIVLVGLIGGGIWKLADELSRIDQHIKRVETAVRILSSKQAGDIKTLVDEALTAANKAAGAGRSVDAEKILEMADTLIAEQKSSTEKPPAAEFFSQTTTKLHPLSKSPNPALKSIAFSAQTKLAEYRSSLLPVSTVGVTIDCQNIPGGVAYGTTEPMELTTAHKDGTVRGCIQMLDGRAWVNMVFINSEIYYAGGPVILKNVRFANCTFHTEQTDSGFQFLEYAALMEAEFSHAPKGSS